MTRDQTITGVVLTLNEEADLPRALKSLAWCDELLVVDSGSTDRTHEVAELYGARFVTHIQPPPFLISEQRNWALTSAGLSTDWVLFLDADEEVGPVLAEKIRIITNLRSDIFAYELTPRYWFLGKWLKRTQSYPNWHPRLLRRGATLFAGGVWESFLDSTQVGKIHEPYEHYAFSKGIDDWLDRHKRYATWEADSALQYLRTSEVQSFQTKRALHLRRFAAMAWPIRPPVRFLQKYFFNLGFLEGCRGLLYSLLIFFYELIIVIKIIQKLRLNGGKPL